MRDKVQFWTTFVLALIGALAWTPTIFNFLKSSKIEGKIISRYTNINKQNQTMHLYKLSVFSKHKPFNIRNISCEIDVANGEKARADARNNRLVVFTFDKPYKLLVPGDQFLNNSTLLPAEKNVVGYLCFHFHGNYDRKLKSTTFIFESFDGKVQRLVFQESSIQEGQLFFDDTIWEGITGTELQKHPALQPLLRPDEHKNK
jgi:hypothetical protein